jgi:hypothetical protein
MHSAKPWLVRDAVAEVKPNRNASWVTRPPSREKREIPKPAPSVSYNGSLRLRSRNREKRVWCFTQPQARAQIQPFGGGVRDIVPAPSGIRAVGDGAVRPLFERTRFTDAGVPGCEAVGEPTEPKGVTGFIGVHS